VIVVFFAAVTGVIVVELVRWSFRPEARRLRAIKKIARSSINDRKWVVIGTSGSHDYLKDTQGARRFWPRIPAQQDQRGDLAVHHEAADPDAKIG
jgi:hypothetical protein